MWHSDRNKNCLSVGDFVILSIIRPVYTSLCRSQKKIIRNMLYYSSCPLWDGFWNCFFRQVGNTALCLKKYHKNSFYAKLTQNVCLNKINILYVDMSDVTDSHERPIDLFHQPFTDQNTQFVMSTCQIWL